MLFEEYEIESVRVATAEEMRDSRAGKSVVVNFAKWGECGEALQARHVDIDGV